MWHRRRCGSVLLRGRWPFWYPERVQLGNADGRGLLSIHSAGVPKLFVVTLGYLRRQGLSHEVVTQVRSSLIRILDDPGRRLSSPLDYNIVTVAGAECPRSFAEELEVSARVTTGRPAAAIGARFHDRAGGPRQPVRRPRVLRVK